MHFHERDQVVAKVAEVFSRLKLSGKEMDMVFELSKLISEYNVNL